MERCRDVIFYVSTHQTTKFENMFRLANPEFLYALLVIPALMVFFWYARRQRRKALALFGQKDILTVLMPNVSTAPANSKIYCTDVCFGQYYHWSGPSAVRLQAED